MQEALQCTPASQLKVVATVQDCGSLVVDLFVDAEEPQGVVNRSSLPSPPGGIEDLASMFRLAGVIAKDDCEESLALASVGSTAVVVHLSAVSVLVELDVVLFDECESVYLFAQLNGELSQKAGV